ncbi:hypothetical protein PF005_g31820 [Phytophthora fragariae]|uniref:Uncharacterized protein n=1 Tax=Phytophthora fragariae TaxID=53985 RepID=A0A6A3J0V8_9STRA|nr:hypothetical protein PF003_g8607 [Phytophthora fragariae]KAE8923470.1 hypothetical protein PF009_g26281 [Phytophthora fragariae]KAE8988876.1 hypothetical protein PF011_g19003 [Phytophthora fragariae]KAE9088739.1 hypothetical protein PF010_g19272 [Phytophthora fragariae]KAE9160001.1 hypothetical protein PF005_g31820 [Phytophthora fragariae]
MWDVAQPSTLAPWSTSSESSTLVPNSQSSTLSPPSPPLTLVPASTISSPYDRPSSRESWTPRPKPLRYMPPASGHKPSASKAGGDLSSCGRVSALVQHTSTSYSTVKHGRVHVGDASVQARDVPAWFSEAFESDGYDSEAVALVLELPEKKLKARTEDRVVSLVPPST